MRKQNLSCKWSWERGAGSIVALSLSDPNLKQPRSIVQTPAIGGPDRWERGAGSIDALSSFDPHLKRPRSIVQTLTIGGLDQLFRLSQSVAQGARTPMPPTQPSRPAPRARTTVAPHPCSSTPTAPPVARQARPISRMSCSAATTASTMAGGSTRCGDRRPRFRRQPAHQLLSRDRL